MNTIIRQAGVGIVVALGLCSSTAFATDTMSLAGTSCLPDNGTDNFTRDSGGGFRNSAGGTRDIHCPVVHDRQYEEVSDLDVFVDLPPSTTTTCYLRSLTSTGSQIATDTGTTSSDVTGADVDFDPVSVGSAYGSYLSLRCSLPDTAEIIAYSWVETDA